MGQRFYQQQGGFKSRAQKRGFQGVTPLRKKLRRLDKVITAGITEEVEKLAKEVEMDAIGYAFLADIRDSGDMIDSISYKLGRDGLTATVGPGASSGAWQGVAFDTSSSRFAKLSIKSKEARWNFIKGYWAEFGTEQRTDTYTYMGPGGKNITVTRDHPGQDERPFMNRAWDDNKKKFIPAIDKKIERALELASDLGYD